MTTSWQFGTRADGQPILAYKLTSESGFQAVILNQGAILQSFHLPNGRNITLGFDTWQAYENDASYVGRLIGPNANRIAGAQFQIDGEMFSLVANDGANNLHGGPQGFDEQIWDIIQTDTGIRLELQTTGGQNGFPGTTKAILDISLVQNKLRLEMEVKSDRPTPMNLTWHPYWNLGNDARIDGHDLCVDSETHTKLHTENPLFVKNTWRDFTRTLPLGSVQLDCSYKDVKFTKLTADQTTLTVTSSLPGLQVYTGDALPHPRTGIALEPQFRPNDINIAQDSLLRPGEIYSHWIEYCFDTL